MNEQRESPATPLEYASATKRGDIETRVGVWSFRLALAALALVSAAMLIPVIVGRPRSWVTTRPTGFSSGTVYPPNWGVWEDTIKICLVVGALFTVAALILGIIGVAQRTHARRLAAVGLIVAGIVLMALLATG